MVPHPGRRMNKPLLAQLQATIDREIPICAKMGIEVVRFDDNQLTLRLPIEGNRNHKRTAFAGSLNALCTVTGWALVCLLAQGSGSGGDIVIRRGKIRYLKPLKDDPILSTSNPLDPLQLDYFYEMLAEKGQSKLDVDVTIPATEGLAVRFSGSYVVLGCDAPPPTARR